jgi:hypothetical protein
MSSDGCGNDLKDPKFEVCPGVLVSGDGSLRDEAFAAASELVLAYGQSILQTVESFVVRVFPDGHTEVVKPIELPISVSPGTIYSIK